MSPRAPCRLASLGFEHVYDYMPGKVDRLARGLPVEGGRASEPRAVDVARRDVVTCSLDTTVGNLRDQVARSPYGFALVLGPDGVLLGRLHKAALQDHPDAHAEDVMQSGPSTTRPDGPPNKLLAKLQQANPRQRCSPTPTAVCSALYGEAIWKRQAHDEPDHDHHADAEFLHTASMTSLKGARADHTYRGERSFGAEAIGPAAARSAPVEVWLRNELRRRRPQGAADASSLNGRSGVSGSVP